MKYVSLFILLILYACSSPQVPSTDQYLGTYVASGTRTVSYGGSVSNSTRASTVVITKGATDNEIRFVEGNRYLAATLSGNQFVFITPVDTFSRITGSGSFSKNTFNYSSTTTIRLLEQVETNTINGTKQ